jgi:hypothetical protein
MSREDQNGSLALDDVTKWSLLPNTVMNLNLEGLLELI